MGNRGLNFGKIYALRANFFIFIRNLRIKAIKITVFLTINTSRMNNNFVVGLEVYSTNFESGDHLVIKSLNILINIFLLSCFWHLPNHVQLNFISS